ncbi:MAG TPA: amidohydrolase [Acidimicrobiales bacterium]|nr:amidohydrolase [Acidimicrobiales bacterium]
MTTVHPDPGDPGQIDPGQIDIDHARRRVVEAVDQRATLLVGVSHRIHERPELLFEEHFAADLLASTLESEGFIVDRGALGLETAFVGRPPDGCKGAGARVAVLCEYDALPGIGHGCGHNIIAAAGLGAALAAATVVAEAGGRLDVIGTPAEEGGGGKVLLGDRGAFDGVDAALAIHPAGLDLIQPDVIAIATYEVEYLGRAAHAAAAPERGRNALDAAVLGYNAVAALRQHIASTDRVHGVFLKAGEKPNIVPERTLAQWYVRSATATSLQALKLRVLACLEAGAAAAGCTMEVRQPWPEYTDLRSNGPLGELYRANSARIGRPVADPGPATRLMVSTDMGNVSYRVPTIHPIVKVSPAEVGLHSAEFAGWAASPDGDRGVLDAAKAMAMTVVDLWLRPGALDEVRAAFTPGP